ncbi:MAG TPA: divergent PAP2 family protein [Lachnospiraceae bacterium]|nr:divergent PAP2 family protein [Lachnospiraceae bacterium]
MNYFEALIHNEILMSALSGWFTAQILKTILHCIVTKTFVAERLVGTGGMPSSHSATVCALATATFINFGISSVEFSISLVFAIVVMYDALGVRRQAGKQAKVLNEMMELFNTMEKTMTAEERLKEFVGHTPFQVLIGAIIGIALAIFLCNVL